MKINIDIPEENLKSMLLSATEFCGYWARTDANMTASLKGCLRVRVVEHLEGYVLNRAAIHKGLELCAAGSPHAFKLLLENNCDGPAADVILQYALFGELKFG